MPTIIMITMIIMIIMTIMISSCWAIYGFTHYCTYDYIINYNEYNDHFDIIMVILLANTQFNLFSRTSTEWFENWCLEALRIFMGYNPTCARVTHLISGIQL